MDERLTRLFGELETGRGRTHDDEPAEQSAEVLLDAVFEALSLDSEFEFDETLVKANLDEFLVALIAMRSHNANGKTLMADLADQFDSELSPGSVYPKLHEMNAEGMLEMFELVRSKEYRIEDPERAASMTVAAAQQHLALGAFLYAAADEF